MVIDDIGVAKNLMIMCRTEKVLCFVSNDKKCVCGMVFVMSHISYEKKIKITIYVSLSLI